MSMFDILKKLTGGPKAATAADLRAALDTLDADALEAAVHAAEREITEAILSGAESAVAKSEERLAVARRDRDRAMIARVELEKRLAAAEAAEAKAALDAERTAAEAEAKAVSAALRREWPALQTKMVGLLERLDAAEEAVKAVNARLHAAGRADAVADVEWRARARPLFSFEGAVSIAANVALPEIAEWSLSGYGPNIHAAAAFWSAPQPDNRSRQDWPAPRVTPGPETVFPTSY